MRNVVRFRGSESGGQAFKIEEFSKGRNKEMMCFWDPDQTNETLPGLYLQASLRAPSYEARTPSSELRAP